METGTGLGQATARMVWALARNGRGRLVGCDTSPDRLQATRQAVDATRWWKVAPLVIDLRLCSGSELELEPDATVDLAYLDSCYRCRVPELLHLRRWLRPGAVVAVHDTRPEAGSHEIEGGLSLRQALQRDVVAPGLARAIDLPTPRGLTLLEVLP
ncbi:MAG: class I SAM-dependent methyltransferase [Armatimonadota bacterium]|nr:class I SAM-dependent methyltransferase [Armatimonadota bacterium]